MFISNLKRLRNARGLTQAELAEKVEISLSGYAQIEYGTSWPTPKTMGALAEKLGVTEADFFKAENDERVSREGLIATIVVTLGSLDDDELRTVLATIRVLPSQLASADRTAL